MIKRLIIDVDGTLITKISFNKAFELTLKRLKIYSDINLLQFEKAILSYEKVYNNYNKKDYLKHLTKYLNIKLDNTFFDIFFDELKKCVPKENHKLKKSISELFKYYELVLLTNYFKQSQLNRLESIGIKDFFLDCFGEELIKPNPEIYIKACGNHKPCECVMIGDDINLDIKPALNLGINAILVNSKDLKNLNINYVVSNFDEISTNYIESLDFTKTLK